MQRLAAILLTVLPGATAIIKEFYTTNSVCKQRYCVNPVFPGLAELPSLQNRLWVKHKLANVSQWMSFCGPFVDYDPALPYDNSVSFVSLNGLDAVDLAKTKTSAQDSLASKMYFFHLSGMGIEAWDHQTPAEDSSQALRPCARSVAKMLCYTAFPKALPSVLAGQQVTYQKPCQNVCTNYLQACDVECCDEGATCTWDSLAQDSTDQNRTTQTINGQLVVLQTGYEPVNGPALQCTGGSAPRVGVVLAAVAAVAGAFAL
jgi:hypothetical protein